MRLKLREQDSSVIFVLGTFHSATTILYRMLAMHPDTTWFSQFSLRDGSIPGRRRLPFHVQIDRMSRRVFDYDWDKKPVPWGRRFVARPTEGQTIWRHSIPGSGSIDSATSVERLRGILEKHMLTYQDKYFLAKYPYITRHVSILSTAYPRAKFVHIIRDGRAVALSLDRNRLSSEERDYVIRDGAVVPKIDLSAEERGDQTFARSDGEGIRRAAEYWMQCIDMVQAAKNQIDLTEIRYEDFCVDVRGQLTRLLEETGLDVDRFPLERCPPTLVSTNERRMQAASPQELAVLETLLADTLRRYSYIS